MFNMNSKGNLKNNLFNLIEETKKQKSCKKYSRRHCFCTKEKHPNSNQKQVAYCESDN